MSVSCRQARQGDGLSARDVGSTWKLDEIIFRVPSNTNILWLPNVSVPSVTSFFERLSLTVGGCVPFLFISLFCHSTFLRCPFLLCPLLGLYHLHWLSLCTIDYLDSDFINETYSDGINLDSILYKKAYMLFPFPNWFFSQSPYLG